MKVELHRGDLAAGLAFGASVAVDTETMGLDPRRDALCLVQISAGDGRAHLVKFPRGAGGAPVYDCPRLKALLADPKLTKIFHFARFDIAVIRHYLGVDCRPLYCTKIASRLARTYTDQHGLKDLARDLLGVEIAKTQQSSDWGAEELSPDQLRYAAQDVLHLHALRERLDRMLARSGRTELAAACFEFLPQRAALDLAGWAGEDIFAH
ncbi:MAG: ribonuclease D [Proteobacteria bacterium]|nr:ribonuclease D [Pseudomonadota bacterium]